MGKEYTCTATERMQKVWFAISDQANLLESMCPSFYMLVSLVEYNYMVLQLRLDSLIYNGGGQFWDLEETEMICENHWQAN